MTVLSVVSSTFMAGCETTVPLSEALSSGAACISGGDTELLVPVVGLGALDLSPLLRIVGGKKTVPLSLFTS